MTVIKISAIKEKSVGMPSRDMFMKHLSVRGLHTLCSVASYFEGEDLSKALDFPGLLKWVRLLCILCDLLNDVGRQGVEFGKKNRVVKDLTGRSIANLREQRVTVGDFKENLVAMSHLFVCKCFIE
jgi:hypothetical protein